MILRGIRPIAAVLFWIILATPAVAGDPCSELSRYADPLFETAANLGLKDSFSPSPAEVASLREVATGLAGTTRRLQNEPSRASGGGWSESVQLLAAASERLNRELSGSGGDFDSLVDSYRNASARVDEMIESCGTTPATSASTAPVTTSAPTTLPAPQGGSSGWTPPAPEPSVQIAAASGSGSRDVPGEMITAHNAVRAEVGVGPMSWSPRLAASAQAWSQELAARGCVLQHSAQQVGENLAGYTGKSKTPTEVVGMWLREKACYRHAPVASPGECSSECRTCGHYTQMIWRASTRLGCGVAACSSGGEVWVCQYEPQGNYRGRLPY